MSLVRKPDTLPPTPRPLGRPPERVTVLILFKMAFGAKGESRHVPWPKNWPYPQVGDQITIGEARGIVANYHFYPTENKIVIQTR